MRPRPLFVIALALSIATHLAFTLWPVGAVDEPPEVPLQATLTEIPPPPAPAITAAPQSKPRRSPTAVRPSWRSHIDPPGLVVPEGPQLAVPPQFETLPEGLADAIPETPSRASADAPPLAPPPSIAAQTLPPRVDLAYRVFLGTQGFYIGDATYRFEHDAGRYRIHSVGEARGLAALLLRGQGKLESEGAITADGLKPDWFALVRGAGRKREVARFDWNAQSITLDDEKTEALDTPTFDPLAVLWQFYFLPPAASEQTFAIATTRRVYRYRFTREDPETLELPWGTVDTERWHRRSEDGKSDAYVWLAPKLHYVTVKLRLSNTERGTVEALLDAIRVDPTAAR